MGYFPPDMASASARVRRRSPAGTRVRVSAGGLGDLTSTIYKYAIGVKAPTTTTPATTAPTSPITAPTAPSVYTQPTLAPSSSPTPVTDTATAAAPIVGAISPTAGVATAMLPVLTQAANAEPTTPLRFDDAEVYNADGSPVTKKAQTFSFLDSLKKLPPAAKIGGAVVLFLLLSGGRR